MIPPVRATSLASRFLVTLLVTCVLPLAVFGWFTLASVRSLIDAQVVGSFVPRLAADHAQQIEDRLRQVYQTCSVVREIARRALEGGQELAAFEDQIELVPDLLDNYLDLLLLADDQGEVVYWQDGHYLDPNTRAQRAAQIPRSVAGADWFERLRREASAFYLPLDGADYLRSSTGARPRDPAAHHLGLAIDVPRTGRAAGAMLALIRWQAVQQLVDGTRAALVGAGYPSAQVFLVDGEGIVRAHTDRAAYGRPLEPAPLRDCVRGAAGGVAFTAAGALPSRCSFQRLSRGAPAEWTIGLVIPETELFAATDAFTRVFVAAIVATLFVLVVWSLAASRAIARPVRELVHATTRVARGDLSVRVPAGGGSELGELAASFNLMAQELARGRERLAVAEREKAWAEMARQVAHEIKNPLTPMRMAAQLLLRARRDGDPRADAIAERLARTVETQTEELARIAGDFRQFAGEPLRALEDTGLDAFLQQVRGAAVALFEADRLSLTLELGAAAATVRVDRRELQRVFVNLLQNAVQARPAGVAVTIRSQVEPGHAVVRVVDDGPGIADGARARLFDPYFTTKTAGTGLGLAICRRILEGHGGTIGLEATGASGSTFRIELPLPATPAG